MKQKPNGWVILCGLAFALLVLVFQERAFIRCNEKGGYYDFQSWQCVVIPGAQVTIP